MSIHHLLPPRSTIRTGANRIYRRAPAIVVASLLLAFGMFSNRAKGTADSDSARAMVEKAYEQRRPVSMKVEMTMKLVDEGREWRRTATLFAKRRNSIDDYQLFKFVAPADLAGSAVLTREQHEGDDDQWVYIPAYHSVRRIPAANRGDSYLGTDFFYEDVLDPRWSEYSFREVKSESLNGTPCLIIEAVPTAARLKSSTAYSRTLYWIDPKQSVILRQEFYDKSGKLLKRLKNSAPKKYGKYLFWDQSVMENLQSGHKTITNVTRREVDEALSDEVFTPKALKRG